MTLLNTTPIKSALAAPFLAGLILACSPLPVRAQSGQNHAAHPTSAQTQPAAPQAHAAGMPGMAGAPMQASTNPMMQSMQKMQQDMVAAPMTGDTDRDFVAMMIPHHQSAIDMARLELQHGKDPMLRELAQAVIKAQETEIAAMKAWQEKHPAKP
jgi:uncharacterized protein (DUF305 family)